MTQNGKDIAFEMMDSLNSVVSRAEGKKELVYQFMKNYFNAMYEIEIRIAEEMKKEDKNGKLMDKLLDEKIDMFNQYWLQDDKQRVKFYKPCSWSGDPEHDWARVSDIEIFETGDDVKSQFLFVYKYSGFFESKYVYSTVFRDNRLLIVDSYFDL